jgi:hypothetical protein
MNIYSSVADGIIFDPEKKTLVRAKHRNSLISKTQVLFGIAFEKTKRTLYTQKAHLQKKSSHLVKKLKALLKIKKA